MNNQVQGRAASPPPRDGTLRHFLHTIRAPWCPEAGGETAREALLCWFQWPADTFLLTSRLLGDTGLYRFPVVQTAGKPWPPVGWATKANELAVDWLRWVAGRNARTPTWVDDRVEVLQRALDVPMARLFDWQRPDPEKLILDLCETLLEMHCVADSACVGLGLPSANMHPKEPEIGQYAFLANMLLISTGSLSRLPRYHGVVLPRMRTPQVGMTLRSLALHVTCHRTDVEVQWRSLPWVNRDENTINVLVVPVPYEVSANAFRPFPHPRFAETLGQVRYFTYQPPKSDEPGAIDVAAIAAYVDAAQRSLRKVHLIVLPELALTENQLRLLQNLLAHRFPDQPPLIVAGVTTEPVAPSDKGRRGNLAANEVVLSTYFAGKWYDMRQAKHHRWRVDGPQVEQYQIAGSLAGMQTWWEAIDLPTRRVSCLAPNAWLALCPLICEDLARQEPVTEVIRGIGPTLVTAILLDGPQLKARWSARYASVLADDPGTSVLTATAFGMAVRSLAPGKHGADPAPTTCSVSLWKDQKTGYREISMGAADGAVLLTMSAEWSRELTADARDDDGFASAFVLHGHSTLRREQPFTEAEAPADRGPLVGDPVDIYELSILTHLVDSIIDHSQDYVSRMCNWAAGAQVPALRPWMEEIPMAIADGRNRLANDQGSAVKEDMRYAIECYRRIMTEVNANRRENSSRGWNSRWQALISHGRRLMQEPPTDDPSIGLSASERRRVHQMVGRSLLWAVHMRLDTLRRGGTLTHREGTMLRLIEDALEPERPARPAPRSKPSARRAEKQEEQEKKEDA